MINAATFILLNLDMYKCRKFLIRKVSDELEVEIRAESPKRICGSGSSEIDVRPAVQDSGKNTKLARAA